MKHRFHTSVYAVIKQMTEEKPAGSLLSIRELRDRSSMPKEAFDASVLALQDRGVIILHHHDFPYSLSETERAKLVRDRRGTYYVGLALKKGH